METWNLLRPKSTNLQFWISLIIGWYISGRILHINDGYKESTTSGIQLTQLPPCFPCVWETCPLCENQATIVRQSKTIDVENSYFRKYPYKPQNMEEDTLSRWRVMTPKHVFETINEEPRVGINGMWRLERESIETYALNYFSKNRENKGIFKSVHRRTDPFSGTTYYVKMTANSENQKTTLVHIQRGFYGNKPKLLEVSAIGRRKMLTIIAPLSEVSDRFYLFLNRFEEIVLQNGKAGSSDMKLLFVIFKTSTEGDDSTKKLLSVLDSFKSRNPKALVDVEFVIAKFNRALGLHTGVQKCENNDLMLFLDVDMVITNEFFDRIRRNTVQHKTVYFPVTFSQYDPKIIDDARKISAVSDGIATETTTISKSNGYWIHYAFGITSMYKSDYEKVGGFKLNIEGWGGEDVDLYKKFISDPEIEVFVSVDRDLVHVYHSRTCNPSLPDDQYRMCVGAWAETLGSQIEVAGLYLKTNKNATI